MTKTTHSIQSGARLDADSNGATANLRPLLRAPGQAVAVHRTGGKTASVIGGASPEFVWVDDGSESLRYVGEGAFCAADFFSDVDWVEACGRVDEGWTSEEVFDLIRASAVRSVALAFRSKADGSTTFDSHLARAVAGEASGLVRPGARGMHYFMHHPGADCELSTIEAAIMWCARCIQLDKSTLYRIGRKSAEILDMSHEDALDFAP